MKLQLKVKRTFALLAIFAMLAGMIPGLLVPAQAGWGTTLRNVTMNAMAYNDVTGTYLIVGDNGINFTSQDGVTWSTHMNDVYDHMTDVIYNDGKFIAVGESDWTPAVFTSEDGVEWVVHPQSITFHKFIYANDMYVAVATGYDYQKRFYTSSDGIDWNNTYFDANSIVDLAFGNGKFVAVGSGETVYTSSDGVSWNPMNTGLDPRPRLDKITFTGEYFIAVDSEKLYRWDGISEGWEAITLQSPWPADNIRHIDIEYAEGTVVVIKTRVYKILNVDIVQFLIVVSNDGGETWQKPIEHSGSRYNINRVQYVNDSFYLMTGRYDLITYDVASEVQIYSTQDGVQLEERFGIQNQGLDPIDVTYFKDQYVAVGGNKVLISEQLPIWRFIQFPIGVKFTSVTNDGNKLVATAKEGIYSSADGLEWTRNTGADDSDILDLSFASVAYGSDHFIAGSDDFEKSGIYIGRTDDNSVDTRFIRYNTARIYDVIYDGSKFIAAGERGIQYANAAEAFSWEAWQPAQFADGEEQAHFRVDRIVYGHGLYVAVGRQGNDRKLWISTDGVNWKFRNDTNLFSQIDSVDSVSLAYGEGTFVAAISNGKTASSTDGVDWTFVSDTVFHDKLTSISYVHDRFLATGLKSNPYIYTMPEVIYERNGAEGAPPAAEKHYEGRSFVVSDQGGLTLEGAIFQYWTDEWGMIYQAGQTLVMPAEGITLNAEWAKSLKITFDPNGGTGEASSERILMEFESILMPGKGNLTMEGYEFVGWNTEREGKEESNYQENEYFMIGDSDVVFYAQWKPLMVEIEFDSNNGQNVYKQSVAYGELIPEPDEPAREGYTFEGWYDASDNLYDFSQPIPVTGPVTFYAKWEPLFYRVTYHSDGHDSGDVPSEQWQSYGQSITVKNNEGQLVKKDHAFAGWKTGDGQEFKTGSSLTLGAANVELYAQWTPLVYLSYDGNGATGGQPPIGGAYESGKSVTVDVYGNTGHLERTGHDFQGWNTQEDGKGDSYQENDTIVLHSDHVTLFAKWAKRNYTVSFESNGGSLVDSQDVLYEDHAVETDAPERNGYTFAGWYTDGALTQLHDFNTPITDHMKLHAKWIAIPSDGDNGGGTPPDNGGGTPPDHGGGTPPDNGGGTPPDNGGGTPPVSGGNGSTDDEGSESEEPAEEDESADESNPSTKRVSLSDKFDATDVQSVFEREQSAESVSFTDVPSQLWSASFIDRAVRMGIVTGYVDGSFNPSGIVTRAEFAQMVSSMLGLKSEGSSFADVQGHWAEPAIGAMQEFGIINGYGNGTFRPDQQITRAEMVAILARLVNYTQATTQTFTDTGTSWAKDEINAFAEAGIVTGKGDGVFDPNASATRAEAVVMMIRLLEQLFEEA